MKTKFTSVLAAVLVMMLFASCTKEPAEENGEVHEDNSVNEWIFRILSNNYLWSLQSDWLTANNSPQYNQGYASFFNSVLQQPALGYGDSEPHDGYYYENAQRAILWQPYSYLQVDDPAARSVSGLQSFGFEFILVNISGTVYAYVIYVIDGSPAYGSLTRGDWIGTVNGRTMTEDNYTGIYPEMIGSTATTTVTLGLFDITFGGISGNQISLYPPVSRPGSVTLTAARVDDDPVYLAETIPAGNGKLIGYIVYNGFQRGRNEATLEDDFYDSTYEESLRSTFRDFRDQGVTDLVLDLRYNPGGYNVTCVLLGSLIRPAESGNTSSVFARYKYRQHLVDGGFTTPSTNPDSYDYFMTTSASNNPPGTGVNNYPGFDPVYILTSNRTASASEMLINSLRGAESRAVEVHVIGGTTSGKNVGSSLFDRTFDDGKTYTMYPIMFQNFSASGRSDFANGFAPGTNSGAVSSYTLDELTDGMVTGEAFRLKEWGSPDDPLLGKAIEMITGVQRTSSVSAPRDTQDSRSVATTLRRLPESSLDRKPVRGSIRVTENPD